MENEQYNQSNYLKFLDDLNDEQREAVTYCNSPLLVLSGAGSGKTRVLTYKIAFLIKVINIRPENILALTFTNKAANEMKQRLSTLIGKNINHIEIGTFHSIFCKILRRNAIFLEGNKYKPDFQIIDEDDVKKIIRDILELHFEGVINNMMEKIGINDRINYSNKFNEIIKTIKEKIMLLKNKGITYEDYFNLSNEIEEDKKNNLEFFKNIYEVYVRECQKKNLMDFEDLLLYTFLLFKHKNNLHILERYQNKYKYILVDEFQDTNHVQFEILKALSWNHQNICGVGDDYQNIYSFRGATLKNIIDFQNNFKNTKIFKLCRNYRSSTNIVKVADLLIKHNKKQIPKDLYSNINDTDGKVKILINNNEHDESEKIAYIIKLLVSTKQCDYKDIAVLYRMNIQSFIFQKKFFKRNIPHILCNRIGFYESKIIINIFSYLKLMINPNLDFCLKRIINYPPRNIGTKTQNKLFCLANKKKINFWEIIKNCDNKEKIKEYEIDKELSKKLLPFKETILYLMSIKDNPSIYSIINNLVEYLKLKDYLKDDPSSKEKINMLLEKVEEMENEKKKEMKLEKYTLNDFLEETSLNLGNEESNDEANSNNANKVKLMTIHQAKGLEFKYVFVIGLEEGYYPSFMSSMSEDEVEEERRILYVAITRAKINCYISYALKRTLGDEERKRETSRFVDEISNGDLVQVFSPPLYYEYIKKIKIQDETKKKEENKTNENLNKTNDNSNKISNNSNKVIDNKNNINDNSNKNIDNKNDDNIVGQDNHNDKNFNSISNNYSIISDKSKNSKKNGKDSDKKKIKNNIKNDIKNEKIINQNENKANKEIELDENEDNNFFLFQENMYPKNLSENESKEKNKSLCDGKNENQKDAKKKKNEKKKSNNKINKLKDLNSNKKKNNNKEKFLNKKRLNFKTLDSFVIFK